MRRLEYDGEFFFLRSNLGAVSKGATPVKYTDICHFQQIGINAEKFQNTRIRFLTVTRLPTSPWLLLKQILSKLE